MLTGNGEDACGSNGENRDFGGRLADYKAKKESMVNHPSHYNQGRFEVIEVIEDQRLGFHLGNAIKYICRAGKKDPRKLIEDLEKAIWYVRRFVEIQRVDPRRPNDMNPRVEEHYCEGYTHKELWLAVGMGLERGASGAYDQDLAMKAVMLEIEVRRMKENSLKSPGK